LVFLLFLETRIVIAKKQIDDTINSMIAAESIATKRLLDKKINDLSILVEDLELQKTALELERGLPITKQSILDFIAEFTDGDPMDKAFQKRIIDNLVMTVYAYDDQSVIYFSVGNRKNTLLISKKETDEIIKATDCSAPVYSGSTLDDIGGAVALRVEPTNNNSPIDNNYSQRYIFVNGIAGMVIF